MAWACRAWILEDIGVSLELGPGPGRCLGTKAKVWTHAEGQEAWAWTRPQVVGLSLRAGDQESCGRA